MKYFYLSVALTLGLASCGGGACDNSTAEGAAKCGCEMADEAVKAIADNDEAKMKELEPKMQAWETEVEANMEAGKYTENDVEAAMEKIGCDM